MKIRWRRCIRISWLTLSKPSVKSRRIRAPKLPRSTAGSSSATTYDVESGCFCSMTRLDFNLQCGKEKAISWRATIRSIYTIQLKTVRLSMVWPSAYGQPVSEQTLVSHRLLTTGWSVWNFLRNPSKRIHYKISWKFPIINFCKIPVQFVHFKINNCSVQMLRSINLYVYMQDNVTDRFIYASSDWHLVPAQTKLGQYRRYCHRGYNYVQLY